MKYYEITNLYREIGKEFRSLGAERVLLISSKTCNTAEREMILEVAVEGVENAVPLQEHAEKMWPSVQVQVILTGETENGWVDLEEDGIVL